MLQACAETAEKLTVTFAQNSKSIKTELNGFQTRTVKHKFMLTFLRGSWINSKDINFSVNFVNREEFSKILHIHELKNSHTLQLQLHVYVLASRMCLPPKGKVPPPANGACELLFRDGATSASPFHLQLSNLCLIALGGRI